MTTLVSIGGGRDELTQDLGFLDIKSPSVRMDPVKRWDPQPLQVGNP